eukprot:scaffold4525_cov132-Amphora_coffeaeformis.AAC.1
MRFLGIDDSNVGKRARSSEDGALWSLYTVTVPRDYQAPCRVIRDIPCPGEKWDTTVYQILRPDRTQTIWSVSCGGDFIYFHFEAFAHQEPPQARPGPAFRANGPSPLEDLTCRRKRQRVYNLARMKATLPWPLFFRPSVVLPCSRHVSRRNRSLCRKAMCDTNTTARMAEAASS